MYQVNDDGKCAKHGNTVVPICHTCYIEEIHKARVKALNEAATVIEEMAKVMRKEKGIDSPGLLGVWIGVLALARNP